MTAVGNALRKIRHDENEQPTTSMGHKPHTREAKLALASLAQQGITMLPQFPSPTRPIDPITLFVGGKPSVVGRLMATVFVVEALPPRTFRVDVALDFRNPQELTRHCEKYGLIPPDIFIFGETRQKIYKGVARQFKDLEGLSEADIREKAKILLNDINEGVPRKDDFYLSPQEIEKIADRICEVLIKDHPHGPSGEGPDFSYGPPFPPCPNYTDNPHCRGREKPDLPD